MYPSPLRRYLRFNTWIGTERKHCHGVSVALFAQPSPPVQPSSTYRKSSNKPPPLARLLHDVQEDAEQEGGLLEDLRYVADRISSSCALEYVCSLHTIVASRAVSFLCGLFCWEKITYLHTHTSCIPNEQEHGLTLRKDLTSDLAHFLSDKILLTEG